MKMEIGSFFFTKTIRALPPQDNPHGIFLDYKLGKDDGSLIGVLLGQCKKGQTPPDYKTCMALLAGIGMIGTDDIGQALGEEAMKDVIAFVSNKYTEKPPASFIGDPP